MEDKTNTQVLMKPKRHLEKKSVKVNKRSGKNKQQDDDDRSYEEPTWHDRSYEQPTWQWSPNSESQDEARPKSKAKAMPTNRERPTMKLTENNLPSESENDWYPQSWKKQRRGPVEETITPQEIYRSAATAWRRFRGKLIYIESDDFPKSFSQQQDRKFLILGQMVEDLTFEHEYYCPRPKTINGEPFWENVFHIMLVIFRTMTIE